MKKSKSRRCGDWLKPKKRCKAGEGTGFDRPSPRKQRRMAQAKRKAEIAALGIAGANLIAEPIYELDREQIIRLNRYRRRVGQKLVPLEDVA